MSKKNQTIIDMNKKTNEELATMVFQLKLQLMEYRFKKTSGEFKNTHIIKEAKTIIAQALTVLKSRNIEITIGSHGLAMYDRKNNIVTSLNQQVKDTMHKQDLASATESASLNINQNENNEEKNNSISDISELSQINNNKKLGQVSQKNVEKTIRKTQGGGQ
ncbi:MAG: 50S ribosomal protein L29 [Mycoplasmataceae bacterium]|jgi:ribosomal protein L29|nr:50S ribosomal protein L29 [Mycoplasmataceae bacterium]